MESHIDKIKKLLRLSKSSNVHEAELAMQRAMELATRHQVDVEQLRNDPEFADIIHRWFPIKARLTREWLSALNIAINYFHVSACICRSKRQVILAGRADAVEVADYIITFLVRTCRKHLVQFEASEKKERRRMSSGKRAAFKSGFFVGIGSKLREGKFDLMRENNELAIVLASDEKRREDLIAGIVGKTVSIKQKPVRRSHATLTGYMMGRQTQLNRPLTGGGQTVLALEG